MAGLRRYTSAEASLLENRYAGSNRGRYMSPEFDGLHAQYAVTVPLQPRMELKRVIVRHLSENLPDMPLAFNSAPMFIANRLVNVSTENVTRNGQLWDIK